MPLTYRRPAKAWRKKVMSVPRPLAASTVMVAGGKAFPTKWRRTLNYCEKITINPASAGLAVSNYFSCNSLNDPNRTGVGHQPLGFDQIMLAYDHYVVGSAKITITLDNDGNGSSLLAGIALRDSIGGTSDPTTIIEQGNCVYTTAGATGGPTVKSLTTTCDVAKFLGRRGVLSDPNLKGGASSNPAEECYFQVFLADLGSSDPPTINLIVKIEYDCYFIEPKQLTQS